MIYWFTGQPGAGKTVLAKALMKEFMLDYHIDGDDLRELTNNKNYGIKGRVENVETAQKIAHYLNNMGDDVVVSLVAPYEWLREEFKERIGLDNFEEFYVHCSTPRERDHFHAKDYVAPQKNFFDVDTTKDKPEQSFTKIVNYLTEKQKL